MAVGKRMSRLDAVNTMLISAGEHIVSDLVTDLGTDTQMSEWILDQNTLDYQIRGNVGNQRVIKNKNPDATSLRLELPTDTIAAELISSHYTSTDNTRIRARLEGTDSDIPYLYNVTEQTAKWVAGTDYDIEVIYFITFEHLTLSLQKAITASAARQYQLVIGGDLDVDTVLSQREQLFRMVHRAADIDDRNRNILSSSSSAASRAVRRGFGRVASNDPTRFRFWRTIN